MSSRNGNALFGNLLLWGGIGTLAYFAFKDEINGESVSEDEIVLENLKYNPLVNKVKFGGNPLASNKKASGTFNYLGFLQAKHAFGLECHSASAVNIFKSLGVIRPDLTRLNFELTYTNLHLTSDAPEDFKALVKKSEYRIPSHFNDSLRGMVNLGKGQKKLTKDDFADIAKSISEVSDYSIKTGMRGKDFIALDIKSNEIGNYLKKGYVVRVFTNKEGHYVVVTALKTVKDKNGNVFSVVLTDDTWYGANTLYSMNYVYKPWVIIPS